MTIGMIWWNFYLHWLLHQILPYKSLHQKSLRVWHSRSFKVSSFLMMWTKLFWWSVKCGIGSKVHSPIFSSEIMKYPKCQIIRIFKIMTWNVFVLRSFLRPRFCFNVLFLLKASLKFEIWKYSEETRDAI